MVPGAVTAGVFAFFSLGVAELAVLAVIGLVGIGVVVAVVLAVGGSQKRDD